MTFCCKSKIILMTWFGTVYVFHKPQSDITCSKTYSLINMISYWNMRTYLALNTSEPRKTCTCAGRYAIYTCSIIYTWITLAFISETKTYNCHASFKLILKWVTGNCLGIVTRTVTDRWDDDDDDDALFVLSQRA